MKPDPVYRCRLEKLEHFLRHLTPRLRARTAVSHAPCYFNMASWGRHDDYCGTSACAIGWATYFRLFDDVGFKAEILTLNSIAPYYDGLSSWDAVHAFFGLTDAEAANLFVPAAMYPDEVADRIRDLLADQPSPEPLHVSTPEPVAAA